MFKTEISEGQITLRFTTSTSWDEQSSHYLTLLVNSVNLALFIKHIVNTAFKMDLLEAPFPVDKSKINDLQRYQSKNRTRLARQTKSCRTIFHVRRTFSVFAKTQLEVDRLFLEYAAKNDLNLNGFFARLICW